MMLAVFLSSLALGRAARVQEFGKVGNEVSEGLKDNTTRHDGPGAIKAIGDDGSTCLSLKMIGDDWGISVSNCNGSSSQMWEWMDGAAVGLLKNVETGKCLRQHLCIGKGTALYLRKCDADDWAQQFQAAENGPWPRIMASCAHTKMCLEVNDDKRVVLWPCKNSWSTSGNQRMWLDFL